MNRAAAIGERVDLLDDEVVLGDPAVAAPLGIRGWTIGVAGLAAAGGAAAIIAEGGVATDPTTYAAVLLANIVTLVVAGLLWLRGRPSSSFGYLLLALAFLDFTASLTGSPSPGVYLAGILGGWGAALCSTWVLLAFPGIRPRGRAAWAVMGAAVLTFLLGEVPRLLVSPSVAGLPALGRCTDACPANALHVVDAPGLVEALRHLQATLQAIWAVALLVYLTLHFARASRARRRLLLPVFASSTPFVAVFAANAVLSDFGGIPSSAGARALFAGTRIVFPLGFIAGLLLARAYAGEALAFMARRLVGRPPIGAVEQLVRRVLGDPQARLVFWLPRRHEYVDRHGQRMPLDPEEQGTTWRAFGHGDGPVLAVVHDSVLSDDPELVEAVGAASVLALENRQLQQDLLDSVDALRASQLRLVRAASAERRKIERDLHDGVQQKLVALRIQLELALDLAHESSGLGSRLARLGADFDDALDELRSVAHGIYPPLLADEGLAAALYEVARRSTVPVTVDVEDVGRLSEDRETAIYYCCLEAIQNVAKHAGDDASAVLRLWKDRRAVHFSISDDGAGFLASTHPRGAGLTNMTDRIGAVGGTLVVRSAPREGTTVEGRIAIEAGDRTEREVVHV